jgi:hypothetical protein
LEGAAYYAWKHNQSADRNTPLVVEFEADVADVYIDGRDFLFTAFQFWDRETKDAWERQARALATLFGDAVLRYGVTMESSLGRVFQDSPPRLTNRVTASAM